MYFCYIGFLTVNMNWVDLNCVIEIYPLYIMKVDFYVYKNKEALQDTLYNGLPPHYFTTFCLHWTAFLRLKNRNEHSSSMV